MDAATAKRHSIGWQVMFGANRQMERMARRESILAEEVQRLASTLLEEREAHAITKQMLFEAQEDLERVVKNDR